MNQLLPKILIFLTFFGSCIVIGLLLSALVTTSWITSSIVYIPHAVNGTSVGANEKNNKYGLVQFGLFNYEKTLNHGYGERHEKDINVVSVIKANNNEVLGKV